MATFRAVNNGHLIFTISQNSLTPGYILACNTQAQGRQDVSVFLRTTTNRPLLQLSTTGPLTALKLPGGLQHKNVSGGTVLKKWQAVC
jgi:hypothetical protein